MAAMHRNAKNLTSSSWFNEQVKGLEEKEMQFQTTMSHLYLDYRERIIT